MAISSGNDTLLSHCQLHLEHQTAFPFYSLNCRFVGNWPFGTPLAIVTDPMRNFVFCGAGGGVYPIDVSDSTTPRVLSDGIRTMGVVLNLYYCSDKLYIAANTNGVEVWDVTNPSAPNRKIQFNLPERTIDRVKFNFSDLNIELFA